MSEYSDPAQEESLESPACYGAIERGGPGENHFDELYRPVSTSAVVSVVFGLASIVAWFDWPMLAVPALGLVLGVAAWRKIRLYPEDYSGIGLAVTGIAASLLLGGSGAAWLVYSDMTEAPPGYVRISYADLQPAEGTPQDQPPPTAMQLNDQRVFIKGFMYPGAEKNGIRRFILCRDNGTCCFGGAAPKLTDMIDVTLKEPLQAEYVTRTVRVGGTFTIDPSGSQGSMDALYRLEADYFK